jgi:hypothetical protein
MNKVMWSLLLLPLLLGLVASPGNSEDKCEPTEPDALGPFYQPGAPERASVGKGYVLSGVVKSTTCRPIAGAHLEFWLAGPDGNYDDDHRATVISADSGRYRFESNFPPQYSFRPPHIHMRISAPGYKTLVAQHYPREGQSQGTFDLVLEPTEQLSKGRPESESPVLPLASYFFSPWGDIRPMSGRTQASELHHSGMGSPVPSMFRSNRFTTSQPFSCQTEMSGGSAPPY